PRRSREQLTQSTGRAFPDRRGPDFCYFIGAAHAALGCGATKHESDSPFEGGAGGCPVVNMVWHWKAGGHPPTAPLIGGTFRREALPKARKQGRPPVGNTTKASLQGISPKKRWEAVGLG